MWNKWQVFGRLDPCDIAIQSAASAQGSPTVRIDVRTANIENDWTFWIESFIQNLQKSHVFTTCSSISCRRSSKCLNNVPPEESVGIQRGSGFRFQVSLVWVNLPTNRFMGQRKKMRNLRTKNLILQRISLDITFIVSKGWNLNTRALNMHHWCPLIEIHRWSITMIKYQKSRH